MSQEERFKHLKIQLEAIQSATSNFSDDSCIGRGGFGKVYKGKIRLLFKGKTMVALKRLDRAFGQGNSEFWKEIILLSFYRHRNIVSLLGYCDDHGEKILVYAYASRKSLDSYIDSNNLTWVQRLRICVGVARGLAYLHTPTRNQLRIVHRDIKSSNILLDDNWNAKISDFGLSKFAPANNQFTFMITNPAGTPGYIDPLYHETGELTKESDVYSFGVVLFEVLCGRLCFNDKNHRPLIGQVREYYLQNKISELVYSNIKDEIYASSLKLFADIAYLCLSKERKERPLMTRVVKALESALDTQEKQDAKAKAQAKAKARAKAGVLRDAKAKVEAKAKARIAVKAGVLGDGILNVKVLATMDLKSKSPYDGSKHYLVLFIDHMSDLLQNIKTTFKPKEANAELNEEFSLCVRSVDSQYLLIHVNKVISVNHHCHVGEARMKLKGLSPDIPMIYKLDLKDDNYNYIGHLKVEVLFEPTYDKNIINSIQKAPMGTPKNGGLLVIIIKGADLAMRVPESSFVLLRFRGISRKTRSMLNTSNPMWLQEFTFMLVEPPKEEELYLEVFHNYWWNGLIPRKESLGHICFSLEDVVNDKCINLTRALMGHSSNILQVEVHWIASL